MKRKELAIGILSEITIILARCEQICYSRSKHWNFFRLHGEKLKAPIKTLNARFLSIIHPYLILILSVRSIAYKEAELLNLEEACDNLKIDQYQS